MLHALEKSIGEKKLLITEFTGRKKKIPRGTKNKTAVPVADTEGPQILTNGTVQDAFGPRVTVQNPPLCSGGSSVESLCILRYGM